jgi:class 3 adenylate cyclase
VICPNCQHENPDAARFCHNCGTALEAPRPPEGERRRVTVLFADVVGSTGMAERLDPEEMVELMNGAFEFMTRAVVRFGGTVARLMGDSVLAFFGAPVAHEDDAERAVRAGLDIREEARAYASRAGARYGVRFEVRVGIDTGLVVAGAVGSALGTEYTAMGDTPNVAARLQAAAEPGAVLISDATLRLVRHVVDVEPRGPLAVRGRSRPVETFAVLQARAVPLTPRGLEGIHSPMVGRDAERRQLGRLLDALASGEGGFLKVAGEAGIGKSRLLAEARETAPPDRLHWLEGRALSYAQTVAYFPWRQLLGHAIGATDADEPAAVRERLAAAATGWRLPPDDLPFLQAILAPTTAATRWRASSATRPRPGWRPPSAASSPPSPPSARPWPSSTTSTGPIPTRSTCSARLAPATRALPLLLVCLARPDGGPASRRTLLQVRNELGDAFHEITLAPLDPPRTRELLGNLLPDEGLPEATRAAILQRVEGNPFFLEEVIRALIDCGHLVRDGDGWRADAASGEVAIPETLAGVLSARIDRLPEPAKRVAQTAAVLGRIFAHEVLTDVCQQAPPPERIENVGPHLATLAYEELVRERARQPVLEYIFKHALTQETAYDLLLMRRRRELHRRAGEALERFHRQRGDDAAAILARHFLLGEDWPRAAAYARRAGARARKLFALEDALAHFEQALETLDRLASHPARGRDRRDRRVGRRGHHAAPARAARGARPHPGPAGTNPGRRPRPRRRPPHRPRAGRLRQRADALGPPRDRLPAPPGGLRPGRRPRRRPPLPPALLRDHRATRRPGPAPGRGQDA